MGRKAMPTLRLATVAPDPQTPAAIVTLLPDRLLLRLSRRIAQVRLSSPQKSASLVVHARIRALASMVTLALSAKHVVRWSMGTGAPACTGCGISTLTSGTSWALCVSRLRLA